MKHIIYLFLAFLLIVKGYNSRNHIEKSFTDERGLISVQFIQDGKQWGLDYLTPVQYDSLKNRLSILPIK